MMGHGQNGFGGEGKGKGSRLRKQMPTHVVVRHGGGSSVGGGAVGGVYLLLISGRQFDQSSMAMKVHQHCASS